MEPKNIRAMRVPTSGNQVRVVVSGRASYFFGLNAKLNDEEQPDKGKSYMSGILIPKGAPQQVWEVLNKAVEDAIAVGIKTKWSGNKPMGMELPLRDGNIKASGDPKKYGEYAENMHITTKKQETKGRPIMKANGQLVTENGVIESGDWCAFDIDFYPFNNKKKGIASGWIGVTLIEVGERFGGGPSEDMIDDAMSQLYGDLDLVKVEADPLTELMDSSKDNVDDLLSML